MLIRTPPKFKFSQITPETAYIDRRALLAGAGAAALIGAIPQRGEAAEGKYTVDAPLTSFEDATNYNNFYEFGLDKTDPAKHAGRLTTEPWSVVIDGMVGKPGTYSVADLIAPSAVEERVYRLRCVEGWSMVLPWSGVPLGDIIARAEPQGSAKYVAFETLVRPEEMPGQSGMFQTLDWPYVEGLRLDEAMHPLALIATGLYGKPLPNQNGAPLRLVVPWKYGFKGVKSIVRMTLVEAEPPTTWNLQASGEYGFYANVNPGVDHPRWSQASERVIGAGFLTPKRDTEMFNGYAEEVAQLYAGMDLAAFF